MPMRSRVKLEGLVDQEEQEVHQEEVQEEQVLEEFHLPPN